MTGVMVAGLGAENSCVDRQGQGYGCWIGSREFVCR